jgi:pimeloyl-ACP methyl ester carboxylesterase
MVRLPGLVMTDHVFTVPLDHYGPDGPTLEVFAREVVAPDNVGKDLPWLLFLQGGPGGPSPRPLGPTNWIGRAVKTHRVLLLDQRGTGRSNPVTAKTVRGMRPDALAAYLKLFRADSIVADAELIRARLTGGEPWETLGQSYGGFITLTYLSRFPEALSACYVTGGLPGIASTKDELYALTYPLVAAKNARYYRRYPDDVAAVRAIADHLDRHDVRLPDGDQLTTRRLRLLGQVFGMSDGLERAHWLVEQAWHGDRLADGFLYGVMTETSFVDRPIFCLQEFCVAGPHSGPTAWTAQRAIARHPEFDADADPLLFTGEMMYPWMFEDIAALRPFAEAADLLAADDDWPALYDLDRLAANEVPIAAAVYHDDMYVPSPMQLETAQAVGNCLTWITNEYEHDGIRVAGDVILSRLMDMAAGRR